MGNNINTFRSSSIWFILLLFFFMTLKSGFDIYMKKDWGEMLLACGLAGMISGFLWDFNVQRKEGSIISALISLGCAAILSCTLYFAFQN